MTGVDGKNLADRLARALAGDAGDPSDPANSPNLTAATTMAGTILGTAAYTSSEQGRGLARCLARNPKQRLHDISNLRTELRNLQSCKGLPAFPWV